MINGSVIINEEPTWFRKKETTTTNSHWYDSKDYMGYGGYQSHRPHYGIISYKEKQAELDSILNTGTARGLRLGARVERTNGNPGQGVITVVNEQAAMAWSYQYGYFQPYKVMWEDLPTAQGNLLSEFEYRLEDIRVVKEEC